MSYLGEQLSPDGLDLGDLGGGDEALKLLGLIMLLVSSPNRILIIEVVR